MFNNERWDESNGWVGATMMPFVAPKKDEAGEEDELMISMALSRWKCPSLRLVRVAVMSRLRWNAEMWDAKSNLGKGQGARGKDQVFR